MWHLFKTQTFGINLLPIKPPIIDKISKKTNSMPSDHRTPSDRSKTMKAFPFHNLRIVGATVLGDPAPYVEGTLVFAHVGDDEINGRKPDLWTPEAWGRVNVSVEPLSQDDFEGLIASKEAIRFEPIAFDRHASICCLKMNSIALPQLREELHRRNNGIIREHACGDVFCIVAGHAALAGARRSVLHRLLGQAANMAQAGRPNRDRALTALLLDDSPRSTEVAALWLATLQRLGEKEEITAELSSWEGTRQKANA
jgi:hypothetical protein